ncbi:hypothetical protein [Aporhodopirellula aestuarii]|uniref:Uncharacterized protein n=1 Tax=Aporhodopirellula aestuarii TaxID=2950107 RepID=A0ABT0U2M5_9BACT|nr:hypothetical protein [Aporhodopirellula aestuarii]MCM2371061.1 hypothetical protein [Aporhodopirellula aestuarii]
MNHQCSGELGIAWGTSTPRPASVVSNMRAGGYRFVIQHHTIYVGGWAVQKAAYNLRIMLRLTKDHPTKSCCFSRTLLPTKSFLTALNEHGIPAQRQGKHYLVARNVTLPHGPISVCMILDNLFPTFDQGQFVFDPAPSAWGEFTIEHVVVKAIVSSDAGPTQSAPKPDNCRQ